MKAVQVAFENEAFDDPTEHDIEDYAALTRFLVVTLEFCKWLNCDLRDEKVLQGREESSSLCLSVTALALNHKRIADFLCQDYATQELRLE